MKAVTGIVVACALLLSACGDKQHTAASVVATLQKAGLQLDGVTPSPPNPDSPLPKSFLENVEFSIPEVAPKGGQLFVCDTKKNCDAIYAYYDALKALAGPYLYQSPDGKVVLQLNSGLTPQTGAKFEAALKDL